MLFSPCTRVILIAPPTILSISSAVVVQILRSTAVVPAGLEWLMFRAHIITWSFAAVGLCVVALLCGALYLYTKHRRLRVDWCITDPVVWSGYDSPPPLQMVSMLLTVALVIVFVASVANALSIMAIGCADPLCVDPQVAPSVALLQVLTLATAIGVGVDFALAALVGIGFGFWYIGLRIQQYKQWSVQQSARVGAVSDLQNVPH
jgi:hypothetical protein